MKILSRDVYSITYGIKRFCLRGKMKRQFIQAIILTCVIGMSVGAVRTSAQITEARFTHDLDKALTEQQVLGAMRGSASVVVHVQGIASAALEVPAAITLVSSNAADAANQDEKYSTTTKKGLGRIDGVIGGEYIVEVSAPGYETHREKLTVLGMFTTANAFVSLHSFDGSEDNMAIEQPGAPVLTGSARTELDFAIDDILGGKYSHAAPRVKNALKRAPDNPDVHFVAGYYAEHTKNLVGAREEYEKAITLYPKHFSAQLSIGTLLVNHSDFAGAIPYLEKALAVGPNSWRGHWLLAEAYLSANRDFGRARFKASRALELGKDKALEAEITIAFADAMGGDIDSARARLEKFAHDYPSDPRTVRAKDGLAMLANAQAASFVTSVGMRGAVDATLAEDVPPSRVPGLPHGVDDAIPPVNSDAACDLPQVMAGAAVRAVQFVDSLEKFTAKEVVLHETLNGKGEVVRSSQVSFDYLASLECPARDLITLDEMRNGSFGIAGFPTSLAFAGIPGFALIFHPVYAQDFNFACEGLGQWKGLPAWQVHFEQRTDRRPRMEDWNYNGTAYPIVLKGRAWLAADSYTILHIETDLAKPVKEIKLEYEHMSINYAAVPFSTKREPLWLPANAEVFTKQRGHYSRQEHDFSDFQLFSTNVMEKVGAAPVPKDQQR
jgi:tetratricopeptide (TPR) repeat protein